ncbi:MAG: hypothetical protein QM654_02165, partial [Dysgonamonadaceae bacterium]
IIHTYPVIPQEICSIPSIFREAWHGSILPVRIVCSYLRNDASVTSPFLNSTVLRLFDPSVPSFFDYLISRLNDYTVSKRLHSYTIGRLDSFTVPRLSITQLHGFTITQFITNITILQMKEQVPDTKTTKAFAPGHSFPEAPTEVVSQKRPYDKPEISITYLQTENGFANGSVTFLNGINNIDVNEWEPGTGASEDIYF